MATLQKDPMSGAYQVKQGDSLSKIASTQGVTLASLLASNPQYKSNPNLIHPGDIVKFGTSTGPSYGSLQQPTNTQGTSPSLPGISPQSSQGSSSESFTSALIAMLKEAQGRNQTGQAALLKQGQDIKGMGLKDAATNFNNPLLAPSSGTSLGMSAQNAYDPLSLSNENQIKMANQSFGDIKDLITTTQDAYDKEQSRLLKAKEDAADAEYKMKMLKKSGSNNNFDNDARIREFASDLQAIKGTDGYVDPNKWMTARDLWQRLGGSDATFESNFKRYLNPASYKLAGYQDKNTIDWGAVPYNPPK